MKKETKLRLESFIKLWLSAAIILIFVVSGIFLVWSLEVGRWDIGIYCLVVFLWSSDHLGDYHKDALKAFRGGE